MDGEAVSEQVEDPMVDSVKSHLKREGLQPSELNGQFEFEVASLVNSYSGNPELWSIWYSKIFSKIFEGVESVFNSPVSRKDDTVVDALGEFVAGFNGLAERASKNTDLDIAPLIEDRKKIQQVIKEESNEVTVVLKINGNECSLECLDSFIDNQLIEFDVGNRTPSATDEASLIEHSSEIAEFMNSRSEYRRRPHNKYERTLMVSVRRVSGVYNVSVGVDETRTRKYSVWERILSVIGEDFSSGNYIDFSKKDV